MWVVLKEVSARWQEICTSLNIRPNTIQALVTSNKANDVRLSDALTEWLNLNYNYQKWGKPTWRKVAHSVYNISNTLFLKISEQHLKDCKLLKYTVFH